MSMLAAEKTLLGFRRTRWHGLPVVAVSNGRARAVVHTWGEGFQDDPENVIYGYMWPMDGGKFRVPKQFSPWHGLQFQVNPADPPVSGGQIWLSVEKGFLEDSAVHFARFIRAESYNTFLPEGLEIELYVYCPNNTAFKDYAVVLWHFRNPSSSQVSFFFVAYTGDYSHYVGTEKYVHPSYSALVKSSGATVIWGGDTAPESCFIDGAWRTTDYSDATPNSNWLRWSVTLEAGDEKLLAFIIVYGDTESSAVSNYNTVKAWSHRELLQKEIRFWKAWLDEGKRCTTGIWEVDQLAAISLCQIKSFISQDNYALPSSLGDGYTYNHWPADAWTCYYALTLWGHLNEAKNYFAAFVKNVTEYIKNSGLNLYKSIHICNLIDHTTTQGNYTGEDCFLLPIIAVETWKRAKSDATFRDNIWSWIQTFIDEIEGDSITSGEWKDHFDHKNIYDTYESWLFIIPHELFGNSSMVVSPVNALLARCYEQVADLAEAKGEYGKASTWRSKAKTIRNKSYDFWTVDRRANYYYWGDATEFGCNQGWPSWTQRHEPLPEKPIYRLSWVADIKDDVMRKAVQLYNDDYLANYTGLIAAEPSDNWMFGKIERRLSYGVQTGFDMHLWDSFLAAAYLGFDDIVERFLLGIKAKHSLNEVGFFEEWPTWDCKPTSHYHMVRGMGLFLTGLAFLFNRLDPSPVRKFQLRLEAEGKEVSIMKQTGVSTDTFGDIEPSFEPVCNAKAIIEPLRADGKVTEAGYSSVEDLRFLFEAFTPIEVGDRIRVGNLDYEARTVERRYYKSRIVRKEASARMVIP